MKDYNDDDVGGGGKGTPRKFWRGGGGDEGMYNMTSIKAVVGEKVGG